MSTATEAAKRQRGRIRGRAGREARARVPRRPARRRHHRPVLVWEVPYYPAYYVPARRRARGAARRPSGSVALAEPRRRRSYSTSAPAAARRPAPRCATTDSPIEELRDLVRLDWDAMDAWFEEDEEVFTHPRDPYTRVDILASSRHVRVEVDGVDGRRVDAARGSCSRPACRRATTCPSRTSAWTCSSRRAPSPTARTRGRPSTGRCGAGDGVHADLAWSYRTPLPESQKVAGLVAFYNEKVDIYVDGVLQERPVTKFSMTGVVPCDAAAPCGRAVPPPGTPVGRLAVTPGRLLRLVLHEHRCHAARRRDGRRARRLHADRRVRIARRLQLRRPGRRDGSIDWLCLPRYDSTRSSRASSTPTAATGRSGRPASTGRAPVRPRHARDRDDVHDRDRRRAAARRDGLRRRASAATTSATTRRTRCCARSRACRARSSS